LLPSWHSERVDFTPPQGTYTLNPSICVWRDTAWLLVRTVNYRLTDDGRYETPGGQPIQSRNFLLRLGYDLSSQGCDDVLAPADWPETQFSGVLGFEDMRLFVWGDALWCSSHVRELNASGWFEVVLAQIDQSSSGVVLRDWRVVSRHGPWRHEKNWMPQVDGRCLRFLHAMDPICWTNELGQATVGTRTEWALDNLRGGSQIIPFDSGWLAVVHEVESLEGRRHYYHRFIWFDEDMTLRLLSARFFLRKPGIEFVAGLSCHRDGERLMLSYGVDDREAWIGLVSGEDVRRMMMRH
jgi:hypothetical protein